MLMSLHQFCDLNFNICQTLYNHFVLIKTCKYYTLLSKYILLLLIILIPSIFDIYQVHICNLISLFIKFFAYVTLTWCHICCYCRCTFIAVALSVTCVTTELTEILNMILSYKSYLAFWWHIIYILHELTYIHISEYVITIFFDISFHFLQYIKMHI